MPTKKCGYPYKISTLNSDEIFTSMLPLLYVRITYKVWLPRGYRRLVNIELEWLPCGYRVATYSKSLPKCVATHTEFQH